MKIHEVVPLDKNLKRKVLDYCRENKISGDLIYLGTNGHDQCSTLSDKYNNGKCFRGLSTLGYGIDYGLYYEGALSNVHYFALYEFFDNKSIVQNLKKPNALKSQATLEQRVAKLEAELAKLINTLRSVATSNHP
jgi:hypothetical protein